VTRGRREARPCSLGRIVSSMHVAALEIELHIGASESLKAKRAVVKHLVETARRRFGVSASEVDHHDLWQRAALGFCTVAPDAGHVEEILDRVERFVWSHPEVTVVSSVRHWLDLDP
jgi:uncharacterized protein